MTVCPEYEFGPLKTVIPRPPVNEAPPLAGYSAVPVVVDEPIEPTLLSAMVPLKVMTLATLPADAPGLRMSVEPCIMKISLPAAPPAAPPLRLAPPIALPPVNVELPVMVSLPPVLRKMDPS